MSEAEWSTPELLVLTEAVFNSLPAGSPLLSITSIGTSAVDWDQPCQVLRAKFPLNQLKFTAEECKIKFPDIMGKVDRANIKDNDGLVDVMTKHLRSARLAELQRGIERCTTAIKSIEKETAQFAPARVPQPPPQEIRPTAAPEPSVESATGLEQEKASPLVISTPPAPEAPVATYSPTDTMPQPFETAMEGPDGSDDLNAMETDSLPPLEAPQSGVVAPVTKEQLLQVFNSIWTHRKAHWFHFPVSDAAAPKYSEIITQRMDFTTIKAKIESGEVTTPIQLHTLYALTFQNSLTYNNKKTDVYKDTITVDNFHVRELQRVFPSYAHHFSVQLNASGSSRKQGRPKSGTPKPSTPRGKSARKTGSESSGVSSIVVPTPAAIAVTPSAPKTKPAGSSKKRSLTGTSGAASSGASVDRRKGRPRKSRPGASGGDM